MSAANTSVLAETKHHPVLQGKRGKIETAFRETEKLIAVYPSAAHVVCRVKVIQDLDDGHSLLISQIEHAWVLKNYWNGHCFVPLSEKIPPILTFFGSRTFGVCLPIQQYQNLIEPPCSIIDESVNLYNVITTIPSPVPLMSPVPNVFKSLAPHSFPPKFHEKGLDQRFSVEHVEVIAINSDSGDHCEDIEKDQLMFEKPLTERPPTTWQLTPDS